MFDRLPEDTQTLYAELLTLLVAHEAERGWSHLAGSFVASLVGLRLNAIAVVLSNNRLLASNPLDVFFR